LSSDARSTLSTLTRRTIPFRDLSSLTPRYAAIVLRYLHGVKEAEKARGSVRLV
jgi:hypothetical protein